MIDAIELKDKDIVLSSAWRERLAFAAAESNLRRIALELCDVNALAHDDCSREDLAARQRLDRAVIGYLSSEVNRREPSLAVRIELSVMDHLNGISTILERYVEPGSRMIGKRHDVLKRSFACVGA